MAYFDGFVIPVPSSGRDKFLQRARTADPAFIEHGAIRVVECWGDDVAVGSVTDFYRAVAAVEGESIAFSWIEWPDKATRDRAWGAIRDPSGPEPGPDPARNPLPFDGRRMIHGGFTGIVSRGEHTAFPYVQGFMVPVPTASREAYITMAAQAWDMFGHGGALAVLEAWGEDVPRGRTTDFYRGVDATDEESVVFSYMIWPSREVCQEAARKMGEAEMPDDFAMPFDGMRMVWGGFEPILVLEAASTVDSA